MLLVWNVEDLPRWGLRFAQNSFFPSVPLNDILELEFQLAYAMSIPIEFDNKEYFEFIWFYERLAEQRKKENERDRKEAGETSLSNLSPDVLNAFRPNGTTYCLRMNF